MLASFLWFVEHSVFVSHWGILCTDNQSKTQADEWTPILCALHKCLIMVREETPWLMIVIFSLCAGPTYLEALYLPSSIWWWRQAYCSWQCRSSLSRCPHSAPHPGPQWWGYQEELQQDTKTKLCKHSWNMALYTLRTTYRVGIEERKCTTPTFVISIIYLYFRNNPYNPGQYDDYDATLLQKWTEINTIELTNKTNSNTNRIIHLNIS